MFWSRAHGVFEFFSTERLAGAHPHQNVRLMPSFALFVARSALVQASALTRATELSPVFYFPATRAILARNAT